MCVYNGFSMVESSFWWLIGRHVVHLASLQHACYAAVHHHLARILYTLHYARVEIEIDANRIYDMNRCEINNENYEKMSMKLSIMSQLSAMKIDIELRYNDGRSTSIK